MEKDNKETNQIRITGRLTGSMKVNIERDLQRGYKQADLVKMAFDVYYSQKKTANNY